MMWILLICVSISVWPLLDQSNLLADYLGQMRVQWVMFYLLIFAGLLWKHQWFEGALMLALIIGNLVVIYLATLPVKSSNVEQLKLTSPLKVMSFNVWRNNQDYDQIINTIKQADADIVWLQEVRQELLGALQEQLHAYYPYQTPTLRESLPQGAVLLSRHPFTHEDVSEMVGVEMHRILHATLHVEGKEIAFIGVHLRSPKSTRQLYTRHQQLRATSHFITTHIADDAPLIMAGDMNSVPWRPDFQRFRAFTGMHPVGVTPSWPSWLLTPLRIPIDHIMTRPSLCHTGISRGQSSGSDHFPVMAVFNPCSHHQHLEERS